LKTFRSQILPHREIRPLKITGKNRFLPKKATITPKSERLDPEKRTAKFFITVLMIFNGLGRTRIGWPKGPQASPQVTDKMILSGVIRR
jgi:hypothetical protein